MCRRRSVPRAPQAAAPQSNPTPAPPLLTPSPQDSPREREALPSWCRAAFALRDEYEALNEGAWKVLLLLLLLLPCLDFRLALPQRLLSVC